MDLLGALDIIRNVSDEALHIHAIQTISTIKEIGKRLQFNLIPSSSSVVATPPSIESDRSRSLANSVVQSPYNRCVNPSRSLSASTSRDHSPTRKSQNPSQQGAPATEGAKQKPKRSTVDCLLKGIQREAWWLLEAQKLEDDVILSRKRSLGEDIRWAHIGGPEGVKSCDPVSKLRRVLALRSIAQEHEDKQTRQGNSPTRLGALCSYVSSPETSTLNLKANHTVKESFQTRALHSGLRHLTVEITLNARLAERGLPGNCEAISAVLGLNINHFRCLRYDDFAAVLDALQLMQVPISKGKKKETIAENHRPLLLLLQDLSHWFKRLQNKYNCACWIIPCRF